MKKILILSLLFISGWMSAQAVDLNKENRDPEYVKSIVSRSQRSLINSDSQMRKQPKMFAMS